MDQQAAGPPEPRERAVSSEPCSTRPNPFDDTEAQSRKRRRTSPSGVSRSRSVDSATSSSHGELATTDSEPRADSVTMKDDSDPITPQTPEQKGSQSTLEPRSSRVTINVRTPSRPSETAPSSPPGPGRTYQQQALGANGSPCEDVKRSIEAAEIDMATGNGDLSNRTGLTSGSETSSPPVEVITISEDDDADYEIVQPDVRLVQGNVHHDPSEDFPYRDLDLAESWPDTMSKFAPFMLTSDEFLQQMASWLDRFVAFANSSDNYVVLESVQEHNEMWQCFPDLINHMLSRKNGGPKLQTTRLNLVRFYRGFAQVTACFVRCDINVLRQWNPDDRPRSRELLSRYYIQVLAQLTRPGEINPNPGQIANGETQWPTSEEASALLATFLGFLKESEGGSMAYLNRLARELIKLTNRFPRMCENIGLIGGLMTNLAEDAAATLQSSDMRRPQDHDPYIRVISQTYQFFKEASNALDLIIDKHVNHLSIDCASSCITALTEIYQICLSTDGIVPSHEILEHRRSHLPVADCDVAEAMAYRWRFHRFRRLILSSQMQLRVLAVSSMCSDLIDFWRKYSGPSEDGKAFLKYMADFLLSTGLVAYILSPTCHPEITIESSNIIGFLIVSDTYTDSHTDTLWQTISSAQDPRVSEALVRMTKPIAVIHRYPGLRYLCEKLSTVPVESFGPSMRELCHEVLGQLQGKVKNDDEIVLDATPYMLCIRLIRESLVFGMQSPIAHPELLNFAIAKLKELLSFGPTEPDRQEIYLNCLRDIEEKSRTSLGSLCILSLLMRTPRELQNLALHQGLPQLLIDELEAAAPVAQAAGFPAVLSGPRNSYRKDMITSLVIHAPQSISTDLGPRLWNLLVGPGATCRADRDVGWQILNSSFNRAGKNPFIQTCFSEYLRTLPSQCFCSGALTFVQELITPLVEDVTSILLDDDDDTGKAEIDQLWRMILTAPRHTIEQQAIHLLVSDIYMESRSIRAFSPHRARKVHLALVDRCLRQLSSAAAKLRAFGDGTVNTDDSEHMALVASDDQVQEQELLFIRSLAVLREFHRLYKAKAQFSVPDLASLILDSPRDMMGESAELKYQAFDGDAETDVKPLSVGRLNTVGSLLSCLQEVTGFSNFRIYYRGKAFSPHETDVSRSLDEVHVQNGLLLVKRESDIQPSPSRRIRPGASAVEIEILGHFEELWSFLDMDVKLSKEIYDFLIKLPAEDTILRAIKSDATSYDQVFPVGQPFKALYGVYALRYYISSASKQTPRDLAHRQEPIEDSSEVFHRAMHLLVMAISDRDVAGKCPSPELQVSLSSTLLESFLELVQHPLLPDSATDLLNGPLLESLLLTMPSPVTAADSEPALPSEMVTDHLILCLRAIFSCCSRSRRFWLAFRSHDSVPDLVAKLLLHDVRQPIRDETSYLIRDRVTPLEDGDANTEFVAFFWPLVVRLLKPAAVEHASPLSLELLEVCLAMLSILWSTRSPILDVEGFLALMGSHLLSYASVEDITQPDTVDVVGKYLIRIVHLMVCSEEFTYERSGHAVFQAGYAMKLFWKHLFPPWEAYQKPQVPCLILDAVSRRMIIEIIFKLIEHDNVQLECFIEATDELVPYYPEEQDGENYAYELPPQFERSRAIRASCGYVGLRNLSNTCYLNSLFTQLFMNVEFRRFMLNATVRPHDYSQMLLFQTQKLFAYMQHSIRRFMSPEDCVSCIKTYEDGQIDIHSQMDVDEFYNLLFDRWEGQLNGTEAKRRFRSFYGGQLVQQVASKECNHISERMEPFSAIQCDIKGKNSLEESLQAYVDGEIMEGDNKYKCSTCDRHVDAVKRACLKDIPDHLIFHLKRFDFNIKTLMRSKINDYFAFPNKIDMHPYTIDALSSSSSNLDGPAGEGADSSDMFELVGILVHSGTAESGHYYSFVRERPSAHGPETWIEFNDDVVSKWDVGQMESSCFGGIEYRQPFESGVILDKTYSAYMLFYQRSSAVQKEQDLARQSGFARPEIHPPLAAEIAKDNITLLRRHCLFDPSQTYLVSRALTCLKDRHNQSSMHPADLGDRAMAMALSHLDQVAARAKDAPDFVPLLRQVELLSQSCIQCSYNIYNYFAARPGALRALIQRNPDSVVRQMSGDTVIQVVRRLRDQIPDQYRPHNYWGDPSTESGSVLQGMMHFFKVLFENFHYSLRSWQEVFGFMLSFVRMGPVETAAFLQYPYFKYLLLIIQSDTNLDGLAPQFHRMAQAVSRRAVTRPPSYEHVIALINILLAKIAVPFDGLAGSPLIDLPEYRLGDVEPADMGELVTRRYPLTRFESRILQMEWERGGPVIFLEKLIAINQSSIVTVSVVKTYMALGQQFEDKVARTLKQNITGEPNNTQLPIFQVAPFLYVAGHVYCRYAHDPEMIHDLIAHVSQQCVNVQNSDGPAFLEFQRTVFDSQRDNSGESRTEILAQGLRNLPEWVPGLLTYYDPAVAHGVQEFLEDKVFSRGGTPDLGPAGDATIGEEIVNAVRTLGCRCLMHLKDNFIMQRNSMPTTLVDEFSRVIGQCNRYFDEAEATTDELTKQFMGLRDPVLENISRLAVDDVEEDGSEWENSVASLSEQGQVDHGAGVPGEGVIVLDDN